MSYNRPGAPWKCRAVENVENQNQVSQTFPTALGNRNCDSHIPTATDVWSFHSDRIRKTIQRSPTLRLPDLQSFRLIHGLENALVN